MSRRLVDLDEDALSWAIAVVKDNRFDVEKRKQMTREWSEKYDRSIAHLQALQRKARS